MDEINSFKKGLKDGLPIAIGYFSVSFAFGIFAIENGLTVFQAVIISLLNLKCPTVTPPDFFESYSK